MAGQLLAQPTAESAAPAGRDSYEIALHSRTFSPEPGWPTSVRESLRAHGRLNLGAGRSRMHVLLQLEHIPTAAEREELHANGITLLTYVPNKAWLASLPADSPDLKAARPGVCWGQPLQVADKQSPALRRGELGPWAYSPEKDEVVVLVQFFKDVDLEEGRRMARGHGEILGEASLVNMLVVRLPRAGLDRLAGEDLVEWVEQPIPRLSAANAENRRIVGANTLQAAPYGLDGTGVDVLVFDAGRAYLHNDLVGHMDYGDSDSVPVMEHSTHVAGTVAGNGTVNYDLRGMAPAAYLLSMGLILDGTGLFLYTNPGDIQNAFNYAKNLWGRSADLLNMSLGANVSFNGFPCALEGSYGLTDQLLDSITRGSLGEPFIMACSVGNERGTSSCGTGYDTIAPPSGAKNPIHSGATDESSYDGMAYFSGWGPTDDGRLKPTICAPGVNVVSCDDSPTGYISKEGTSMASPTTAGIIALMLQQYRITYATTGEFLPSSAKALLIHTALDRGATGPDYQYGYGRIRGQEAVEEIIHRNLREQVISLPGESHEYTVTVPANQAEFRVSLAWDDPAGSLAVLKKLVNDLDLEVIAPNGTTNYPWVLTPALPSLPATRGVDQLNNQEQVVVSAPTAGTWRIRVKASVLPESPQRYSLVFPGAYATTPAITPGSATPPSLGLSYEPITNGTFEAGTVPWTLSTFATRTNTYAHGGAYSLRLGGTSDGSFYQQIAVPPNAAEAMVSYWVRMTTSEVTDGIPHDFLFVEIRDSVGNLLTTANLVTDEDTFCREQWAQYSFTVGRDYAGTTIRLNFRADVNAQISTYFYVDDATFYTVPTCCTYPASSLTYTSAVLHAAVNPRGQAAGYYFEYGTTTNYGSRTLPASAGAGSAYLVASNRLSGLTPNRTYHYRIVATNASQAVCGTNASFVATPPPPAGFEWSSIAPTQAVGAPIAVSITAKDTDNNRLTTFTNAVSLSGWAGPKEMSIGSGTSSLSLPLETSSDDCRTQVIYPTNEVGVARTLNSLALDVTTLPGQTLNNWTIRMKHTPLHSYTDSAAWEGTGWTTVYQTNQSLTVTGWVTFVFATPFLYNGTNNLMVDFSYNNSSHSTNGGCRYTSAPNRTLYYMSDSLRGDPLTWSGTNPPTPYLSAAVPNIKLPAVQSSVALSPTSSGPFSSGAWTGTVTVLQISSNMFLRAADGSGHTGDSNPFQVLSSGVHHFAWSAISSPQTAGVSFPVTVTAQDTNGFADPLFTNAVTVAGNGDCGSVLVTPAALGPFTNGQWSGAVTVLTACSNVQLTASDPGAHTGRSQEFNVLPGPVARFEWNPVGATQYAGVPLAATLTARDANNNRVNGFTSSVGLSGLAGRTVGTGVSSSSLPLHTLFEDCRIQIIYLTNELGTARTFTSLALDVTTPPGQALNNWTIRLKHTPLNSYTNSPGWEATGWTTVYQGTLNISSTGWVTCVFTTAFAYNGTNNLLVDFSYNNSSRSVSDGACLCYYPSGNRAIYFMSQSQAGDPLSWSAIDSPGCYTTAAVPNLKLTAVEDTVALSRTNAGPFTNGVWTGTVAVLGVASDMVLRANDGSGHTGDSNPFQVLSSGVHHFAWSAISSPQTAGVSFPVTVTAQDTNGFADSLFTNAVTVAGNGDCGSVLVAPAAIGPFTNGQWSGAVTVLTACSNVQLTASDPGAHTGRSQEFNVLPGPVARFEWNPVGATQYAGVPLAVTLTARDASSNRVSGFTSSVGLSGLAGRTIGTGVGSSSLPLYTWFEDCRTQVIYLTNELGTARTFTSLALDVTTLPGQALNNWTIRLKHTPLDSYTNSPGWEATGWSTVYQGTLSISSTGRVTCVFTTAFAYNGTNNLLVDFSYNNSSHSVSDGACLCYYPSGTRAIYYMSQSQAGDPLTWSSTNSPGCYTSGAVPNLKLTAVEDTVALSRTNAGPFTNGVWTGAVAVLAVASDMVLRANDGSGHTGDNNPFQVLSSGVHHFAWSAISSPQAAGVAFPVTISAQDTNGLMVSNFNNRVVLGGWIGSSAVVLQTNAILSPGYETTAGWTAYATQASEVRVWQSPNWRSEGTNSFGCMFLSGFDHDAGDFGCFRQTVDWTGIARLQVDCCASYADELRGGLLIDTNELWSVHPTGTSLAETWSNVTLNVSAFTGNHTLELRAAAISNGNYGCSFFWDNLRVYRAVGQSISVAPTAVYLTNGSWSGLLAALQVGTNVFLTADDGDGHTGASTPFVVQSTPLLISKAWWDHANHIIFSGTGGSAGKTYYVLSSTNVAAPLTKWVPIATNFFTAGGTFRATNTIEPNKPARFFRLKVP